MSGISPETEAFFVELAARGGRNFELCPRCRCCEVETVECGECGGEGVSGHECGEDVCACLHPEENVPCDICGGKGYWQACMGRCDEHGKHGREERG
jgi:hypothetical protein